MKKAITLIFIFLLVWCTSQPNWEYRHSSATPWLINSMWSSPIQPFPSSFWAGMISDAMWEWTPWYEPYY